MDSSYLGLIVSFLAGGGIVCILMRTIFAKASVPKTEFDHVNYEYRDSLVENVKLEERIAIVQERLEKSNEKLLEAEQELSIVNDDNDSLRSMNQILYDRLSAQKIEIENFQQQVEKK